MLIHRCSRQGGEKSEWKNLRWWSYQGFFVQIFLNFGENIKWITRPRNVAQKKHEILPENQGSHPLIICRTYLENNLVLLGPGSRGNFGMYLPGGAYKSKETNFFSGATSFQLPTASPLKAGNFLVAFPQFLLNCNANLFRETLTRKLDGGWRLGSMLRWKMMWEKIRIWPLSGADQQHMNRSP